MWKIYLFPLAIISSLVFVMSSNGHAQIEKKKFIENLFSGQTLVRSANSYLVLKDVNVRKTPSAKSRRVGRLRKGIRVVSVGRAKGTRWIAIVKNGGDRGFVYDRALVPVLDGALYSPVTGRLTNTDLPSCDYTIEFESKSKVRGALQVTSDYQISFECSEKRKTFNFEARMFITELPYKDTRSEIFQVNVDLPRVADEQAEIVSVICLYNQRKSYLVLGAVSSPKMSKKINKLRKTVKTITEVLVSSIEFSYQVWGEKVWEQLRKF